MSPEQVVCLPYWYQYQSRHSKLPILVHGTLGWMVESSSLSVLNSRNVVDSTLCFVKTADDVECATSLRTDIMVGVRMLILILSSTPETFSDAGIHYVSQFT